MPDSPGWVLWAGTVGFGSALEERFAAASRAGYQRVTASPPELVRELAGGTPAATIRGRAADLGLELLVDPVMNWYPDSAPSPSRFAGVGVDEALRVCEQVGAVSFSAIATATSDVPIDALAEHFAALCLRAADFGADVHLEFIPFTIIRNLRTAWDIVRIADEPNSGLVFDTWHFFRSDADFATLAAVPGERVLQIQLDDAPAVASGTLREETQRRLLPGDGEFDLTRVLRALDEIGALRWLGPEVISPELAALPIDEAAALALSRSRAVVERALAAV